MKTTKLSILAVVAFCGLGASALADQQSPTLTNPQRQVRRNAFSSRTMQSGQSLKKQPLLVRTVEYPFVFLGRAGRSVWHTPQIVSETFSGERTLISKRGVLAQNNEMKAPGQRVASAPRQSIANTRG